MCTILAAQVKQLYVPCAGDIGTVFRRYPEPWKVFIEDADLLVRISLAKAGVSPHLHEINNINLDELERIRT